MPNLSSKKSDLYVQYCSHQAVVAKYGGPVPVSKEVCNRCNDAIVAKIGYCCPIINCANTCTRYSNPDLCNLARDPGDAYKNDPEVLPLYDVSEKLKETVEDPERWKKEPKKISNGKRYGSCTPVIQAASAMNKRLAKEGKI